MRVPVVEDQVFLAGAIQTGLRPEATTADLAHDGDAAWVMVDINDDDILIIDRDIPGTHGDDVCRILAGRDSAPSILMLTAARRLGEKVAGFELGADDYLAKPFEFPELVARLRALNRRSGPSQPPILEACGVRLDPFRREVYRDGRLVRLSRKACAGAQHRRGLREHPSARAHWGIPHGARHGSLTAGHTASAARWWCGVPPRECSAWKIASATSCCACSFSSR